MTERREKERQGSGRKYCKRWVEPRVNGGQGPGQNPSEHNHHQRSFNSNCEKFCSRRESHVFNLNPPPALLQI
jgi:hypothetical protein